jgi:hypothetical protein
MHRSDILEERRLMGMLWRSTGRGLLLAALLVAVALPAGPSRAAAAGPEAGDARSAPPVDARPAGRLGAAARLADEPRVATGNVTTSSTSAAIDTSSREAVAAAYRDQYLANHDAAQGWSGSVSSCKRGAVNTGYTAAVNGIVDYFRNMAGLSGVTMAASLNSLDQAAALIMDANDTLTHAPTSDMDCYTQDGYDGASHSNLCFGCVGPSAIDAYMYDSGSGNTAVGHRRWILFPPQTTLGTGSTTQADALYVINQASWVRPGDAPDWVSWPPKGFVPASQVYPRFSLSRQGAGFGSATVAVTVDGSPVTATVVSRTTGYGDPAIVFEVNVGSLGLGSGDHAIRVTVDGITVSGAPTSYSWSTTSFVPASTAAPAVVTATGISDSEVRLTWHDVAGEDGYRIRRDDGSPTWPVVGTAGANATTFVDDDGLDPETDYRYVVCSYAGTSEFCSGSVTGTTLADGVLLPITVVVDDRDGGFARTGSGWQRQAAGYRDRSFWTPVRRTGTRQTATWTATLHAPGRYAVWVRVPKSRATTRSATYRIVTPAGTVRRTVNQRARAGTWTLLGTYTFDAVARVKVTDHTGEAASSGRRLVVDVIKVVPATP